MQFDVGQYDKNVCHTNYIGCPQFGFPLLKALYFDTDNMIKLDLFDSLFPNTDTMYINSKKKIPNRSSYPMNLRSDCTSCDRR